MIIVVVDTLVELLVSVREVTLPAESDVHFNSLKKRKEKGINIRFVTDLHIIPQSEESGSLTSY